MPRAVFGPYLLLPLLLWASICSNCSTGQDAAPVDNGPADAGYDGRCGPNLRPYKTACIPLLDDCPEADQVPIPGGGCKRVGVQDCEIDGQPGIAGPPDWTCERIGVQPCELQGGGPGLRGPPDWTCEPVGPPTSCRPGLKNRADGFCEPILPAAACGEDEMEVIGQSSCQPVGDCATGRFGAIPITDQTVFVDASAARLGADGSAEHPFPTIARALQQAQAGGHVAVAAGTYDEALVIDRPVTLQGRCPAVVRVASIVLAPTTLSGARVAISGIRVTGGARRVGVGVSEGGWQLDLSEVVIAGCGQAGLGCRGGSAVTLRDSVISANRNIGLFAAGCTATVDRSVIRDTEPHASTGKGGIGIVVQTGASLGLADSLLARNRMAGLLAHSALASVRRSAVQDTRPRAHDGALGIGIYAAPGAAIEVHDALVRDNLHSAIFGDSAEIAIARSIVERTDSGWDPSANWWFGYGLAVISGPSGSSTLQIEDCLISENRRFGVCADQTPATVARTIVRDTRLSKDGLGGGGVISLGEALTLQHSVIEDNHGDGVMVAGSTTVVERSVVRGGKPGTGQIGNQAWVWGRGLAVGIYDQTDAASLVLRDSLVSDNSGSGVETANAAVAVERTVVTKTRYQPWEHTNGGVVVATTQQHAGTLDLRDSIVGQNANAGVVLFGASAAMQRAVVRDTRGLGPDGTNGIGIHAEPWEGQYPSLVLTDCLVASNRTVGINALYAEPDIRRCVVRDTGTGKFTKLDQRCGIGINVHSSPSQQVRLHDTAVSHNALSGIQLFSARAVVQRCAIRDTGAATQADGIDRAIGGLMFLPQPHHLPGQLEVEDTLLVRNRVGNLNVAGGAVTVRRSSLQSAQPSKALIADSKTRELKADRWAEGILVLGSDDGSSIVVEDSLVERCGRTGLYCSVGSGALLRSVVRGNLLSVVVGRSTMAIDDRSVLEENDEDRVSFTASMPAVVAPALPESPLQPPGS